MANIFSYPKFLSFLWFVLKYFDLIFYQWLHGGNMGMLVYLFDTLVNLFLLIIVCERVVSKDQFLVRNDLNGS